MEAKKFPRTPSRNEFHNIRIIFQSFFLRWSGRGTTRKVRAMKVCTTMEGSKMATRAWGREVYNWIPKQSSTLPLPMSREPSGEGCCRIRSENAMLETNLYTTHFRGRKI